MKQQKFLSPLTFLASFNSRTLDFLASYLHVQTILLILLLYSLFLLPAPAYVLFALTRVQAQLCPSLNTFTPCHEHQHGITLSLQTSTSSAPPTFKVASPKISATCYLLNKPEYRFCTLVPAFLTTPRVLNSTIPQRLQPRLLMVTTSLTCLFMRSTFSKASPLADSFKHLHKRLCPTLFVSNNNKFPITSVKTHTNLALRPSNIEPNSQ